MALTATNVRLAVTGAVYTAPTGTTAPTDATTAWAAGWVDLGYVSADGITETISADQNDIVAWQSAAVVRRAITSTSATFQFTLLESKEAVLELFHKGSTMSTATGTSTLNVHSPTADPRAFGFEVVDGTKHIRIIIPNGEVTDFGDVVYSNGDPVSYQMTISAYPNASGVTHIKLSDDTAWTGTP